MEPSDTIPEALGHRSTHWRLLAVWSCGLLAFFISFVTAAIIRPSHLEIYVSARSSCADISVSSARISAGTTGATGHMYRERVRHLVTGESSSGGYSILAAASDDVG